MKVLIVTGGIGSGKSLVSAMLAERGIPVYDSDTKAKALYDVHPHLKRMICPDIFAKPQALKALEDAVYPLLMEDFRKWAEEQGRELVAMESAIILQKEFFDNFGDYVLLVEAPQELRLERAVQRGGRRDDMQKRMGLQCSQKDNPRVDFIIDNSSSVKHAEEQLDKFLKEIDYGKREN